jgi:hypothetical protein
VLGRRGAAVFVDNPSRGATWTWTRELGLRLQWNIGPAGGGRWVRACASRARTPAPAALPPVLHLGVLGTSSFRLAPLRAFDVLCCFRSHRAAFTSLQWIRRVILRQRRQSRDRNRAQN